MQSNAAQVNRAFWVVVADEAAAVIYTRDHRSGPLTPILTFENADARKHVGEILADKGGRSFDSHGPGRHTMAKEKDGPKRHVATVFAKEIAELVAKAIHDGSCRGYALVAAPRFLGLLRDALAVTTTTEPYVTVDKDVVTKDAQFIGDLLAAS